MNTRRFAPGDRVVVTAHRQWELPKTGDRGILLELDAFWLQIQRPGEEDLWVVRWDSGVIGDAWENDIELEQVYESPLWKALE